jgi:hypothetical protein
MRANRKPSVATRAHNDVAELQRGHAGNGRADVLAEALEKALVEKYENEQDKDAFVELQWEYEQLEEKFEELQERARPAFELLESDISLVAVRAFIRRRRESEPIVPPERGYEWFAIQRESTDIIEQLLNEVEAYRKLATPKKTDQLSKDIEKLRKP